MQWWLHLALSAQVLQLDNLPLTLHLTFVGNGVLDGCAGDRGALPKVMPIESCLFSEFLRGCGCGFYCRCIVAVLVPVMEAVLVLVAALMVELAATALEVMVLFTSSSSSCSASSSSRTGWGSSEW